MGKNEILAVVGGREITSENVNALLQSLNPQTAAQFESEEGKKALVKELVNQELLYLDAMDHKYDREEEYLQEVEKMKANMLKQYAVNKLLGDIVVTENEVVNYYVSNKSEFEAPPSVKASHILVNNLKKAEEIVNEIKEGLSFEDAAKKYSSCPSSEQGGDLGYFSRGMMVPEFEDAAFGMKIDDVSAPVKTQFGYHIIKLFDKKDQSVKSLEEVKGQLTNHILAQKQQDVYLHRINELKEKYKVEITE